MPTTPPTHSNHPLRHTQPAATYTSTPHTSHTDPIIAQDTTNWGDALATKPPNTTRLYFQNIRGLSTTHIWTEWNHLLETLHHNEVDIFGFAETNIPWTPTTRHIAKQQMKSHLPTHHISLTTAACDEPTYGWKQPGGVCQGAIGNIAGGIDKLDIDSLGLGRWTYMTITCKHNYKLYIITAYRVSQNTLTTGDDTAYNQQHRTLRRMGIEHPKPRTQFITDLIALIHRLRTTGEIIVMLDANAPLHDKEMMHLLTQTGLYDTMEYVHTTSTPRTYIRGTNTIDHILATAKVLPSIKHAGMLPFNDGIQSDHRGLWLDINTKELVNDPTPTQNTVLNVPSTKHHKHCQYLKTAFTRRYKELNIRQKLTDLQQHHSTMPKSDAINALNDIDRLVDEAMLQPLKTAPKKYSPWWSPALHSGYLILQYWKLCGTESALGIDFHKQKTNIRQRLPPDANLYQDNPGASIQKQIRLAKLQLQTLRRESFALRQQHLETLAQQYETLTNQDRTKILRHMKRQEYMRTVYQKISRYLKPTNKQSLHKLQTTTADGSVHHHTTKDSMESILLAHHKTHFSQAEGTPFTTTPMTTHFNHVHQSKNTAQLYTDAIAAAQTHSHELVDFLHELRPSPMDPPQIDTTITLPQLKQGFRLWRETTSTSPLGRHLPLYKMWLNEEGDEEGNIISGEVFFQTILDIINISHTLQTPLQRWATIHNIFILKSPNDFRPHRLRALHKIDAELNLVRRELIAKRLLRNAEQSQYLDDSNYGGRNGKTANDAVMKKFLTLQIWQLQRHNGALTDCDAKACYDRVVPMLLYQCYHKAGLPHHTCQWLKNCLTQMKYHAVTAHGISTEYSASTDSQQLYGIGQGATDAPTGWLLVSTILSRYYNKKATGTILQDPTGQYRTQWKHVMFVDDTYLIHSSTDPSAPLSTIEALVQNDVSHWNTGLHITGGKLEGNKSKYLILIWEYTADGIPFLQVHDDCQNEVTINLYNNPTEQLARIPHDTHISKFKSLGTYLTGSLDTKYEQQVALEKIQKFTRFLVTCPLKPNETWLAYRQYLIPSLCYGSVIQSFPISTCEIMHKKLLPFLLPKLGYPATLPRPIAFGPRESGGCGILDINAVLLSQKIQYLIKHVRAKTEIGILLRITLRWAQLQAGISAPVLSQSTRLKYIESEWLQHIQEGLWQISGKIYLPDAWYETPQCENDKFLMEIFHQAGIYTAKQLHTLNCCRMYLRISRLSDIRTTDGKRIIPEYYSGRTRNEYSTLAWPTQSNPGPVAWNLWRNALTTILPTQQPFTNPLGRWTTITNKYHWYYDTALEKVCSMSHGNWYSHPTTFTRRHIRWTPVGTLLHARPKHKVPLCEIIQTQNTLLSTNPCSISQTASRPQNDTWHRKQLDATRKYYHTITNDGPSAHSIPNATLLQLSAELYLVSDSGQHDHFGYYGWTIANDTAIIKNHKGFAPGHHEDMDSYRAALAAIVNALIWLKTQIPFHQLNTTRPLQIVCTNVKTVKTLLRYSRYESGFPSEMLHPHMDIVLEILHFFEQLPQYPTLTYQPAPAHKELHRIPPTPWPLYVLSYTVHITAKALDTITPTTPFPAHITYPNSAAQLYINNRPVSKHIDTAIHRAWCTSDLRTYLTAKFNWHTTTSDMIDWYSFGRAILTLPTIHSWIVKFIHDWLPLKASPRMPTPTTHCPICHLHPETPTHFLTCTQNQNDHQSLIDPVQQTCLRNSVDPNLKTILLDALIHPTTFTLETLRNNHPEIPFEPYEAVLTTQTTIGWHMLHYGRFSLAWDQCQRKYLYHEGLPVSSYEPQWIKQVICLIFLHNYKRWRVRNDILHKNEPIDNAEHELLLTRITALYALSEELLVIDQHCFRKPLTEWKTSTIYEMKRWLHTYTTHIRHCRALARTQRRRNTSDIRKYVHIRKNTQPYPPTPTLRTENQSTGTITQNSPRSAQRTVNQYFHRTVPVVTTNLLLASTAPHTAHPNSNEQTTRTTDTFTSDNPPTQNSSVNVVNLPGKTRPIQTSLTKYFQYTS